jgi:hypothetical protein
LGNDAGDDDSGDGGDDERDDDARCKPLHYKIKIAVVMLSIRY